MWTSQQCPSPKNGGMARGCDWACIPQWHRQEAALTLHSLSPVQLDLAFPLRRVGLHYDEGPARDSAVQFPFGAPGPGKGNGLRRRTRVPLHCAGAVNENIGYRGDPGPRTAEGGSRRHGSVTQGPRALGGTLHWRELGLSPPPTQCPPTASDTCPQPLLRLVPPPSLL